MNEMVMTRRTERRNRMKKRFLAKTCMVVGLCIAAFLYGRFTTRSASINSIFDKFALSYKSDSYGNTKSQGAVKADAAQSNSRINGLDAAMPETDLSNIPADSQKTDMPYKDSWNLILVNFENRLPDDFSVKLAEIKNGHSIDERVYPYLQEMMNDARALGMSPLICSSYRTNEDQTKLFNKKVRQYINQGDSQQDATAKAAQWISIPGTSEHQLGLSVDIVSIGNQNLDRSQLDTDLQKWLMENSYKYGFILRYPENKSDITGINFEPWHYRYVGKEVAAEITQKGICLEEYLKGQ